MNNKENTDFDLLKYVSGKQFDELSSEEKRLILKHVTKEEYKTLRETSAHITGLFNDERNHVIPGTKIKDNLLKQFRQKKEKRHSFFLYVDTILNYRVPIYQPAIAMLILFIFYFLLEKPESGIAGIHSSQDTSNLRTILKPEVYLATKGGVSDSILMSTSENKESFQPKNIDRQKKMPPMEIMPVEMVSCPQVFDLKEAQVINGITLNEDTLLASFFTSPN